MKINRQSHNLCQLCELPNHCFAAEAPRGVDNLEKVVKDVSSLKKHEVLFRQEDAFRGIFVIKSGGIKTFLLNAHGDEIITGFYLPGELLGFSALSANQYFENAQALTMTEVCRISYSALMNYAHQDMAFQNILFMMLSTHIKTSQTQSYVYPSANAEKKVALFLLDYATRLTTQEQNGCDFRLLPTQHDIASFLGLTPETISRVLGRFQNLNIFKSYKAKRMTGLNHKKLQHIIL